MRDIRHDLQERIALEETRREPHVRALATIDANIATLRQILIIEEARHRAAVLENRNSPLFDAVKEGSRLSPALPPPKPRIPLIDFLLEMLITGPMKLEALRDDAVKSGYFLAHPGASPGRMIHGALLNSLRQGDVIRNGDESYSLTVTGRERVSIARKRAMERTVDTEA